MKAAVGPVAELRQVAREPHGYSCRRVRLRRAVGAQDGAERQVAVLEERVGVDKGHVFVALTQCMRDSRKLAVTGVTLTLPRVAAAGRHHLVVEQRVSMPGSVERVECKRKRGIGECRGLAAADNWRAVVRHQEGRGWHGGRLRRCPARARGVRTPRRM